MPPGLHAANSMQVAITRGRMSSLFTSIEQGNLQSHLIDRVQCFGMAGLSAARPFVQDVANGRSPPFCLLFQLARTCARPNPTGRHSGLQRGAGTSSPCERSSPGQLRRQSRFNTGRNSDLKQRRGRTRLRQIRCLQPIHQIRAVIRSREYRPSETASGPPCAEAGAQPLPHNPRKQRKNPAAAGPGERLREAKWRRGWA